MSTRATRVAVALVAAVFLMHASGAFAAVGDITTFTDPAGNVSEPEDITTGLDGALWFTSFANGRIGRITTAGDITTFADPAGNVDLPDALYGLSSYTAIVSQSPQSAGAFASPTN